MNSDNVTYAFAVGLWGPGNVGKTAIYRRYLENTFTTSVQPRINWTFQSKMLQIAGKRIKLFVYDIPGTAVKYKAVMKDYLRTKHGLIVVFDISNRTSFEQLAEYIEFVKKYGKQECQIIIVGNKSDLRQTMDDKELISTTEAKEYVSDISKQLNKNITYMEVSAKTGKNVQELFEKMTKRIMAKSIG